MGNKDSRASRLCRRGPALHNPGCALPPRACPPYEGRTAGGVPMQAESPQRPRGEGAGQGGASDHLPSTDRKQAHRARGHLRGRGQPPALQGRPQRTECRPICCLRTSVFPSAICVWLGVGAWRRGREREGERDERKGEGREGTAGWQSLPAFVLPSSELWGREDLAFCCWRRPPSQQPWETPMGDHHGPSFLRCLLKPAFRLYRQDTQLQTPRRGPAASPRASALPPRGCPGRRPPTAAPSARRAGHPQPLLPLGKVPHSLQPRRLRPSAQTGTGSHGPTLSEAPQQKWCLVPGEAPRGTGVLRGRPGSGLGSGAVDASESSFPGKGPRHT